MPLEKGYDKIGDLGAIYSFSGVFGGIMIAGLIKKCRKNQKRTITLKQWSLFTFLMSTIIFVLLDIFVFDDAANQKQVRPDTFRAEIIVLFILNGFWTISCFTITFIYL